MLSEGSESPDPFECAVIDFEPSSCLVAHRGQLAGSRKSRVGMFKCLLEVA